MNVATILTVNTTAWRSSMPGLPLRPVRVRAGCQWAPQQWWLWFLDRLLSPIRFKFASKKILWTCPLQIPFALWARLLPVRKIITTSGITIPWSRGPHSWPTWWTRCSQPAQPWSCLCHKPWRLRLKTPRNSEISTLSLSLIVVGITPIVAKIWLQLKRQRLLFLLGLPLSAHQPLTSTDSISSSINRQALLWSASTFGTWQLRASMSSWAQAASESPTRTKSESLPTWVDCSLSERASRVAIECFKNQTSKSVLLSHDTTAQSQLTEKFELSQKPNHLRPWNMFVLL